jgi:hypothetical protein
MCPNVFQILEHPALWGLQRLSSLSSSDMNRSQRDLHMEIPPVLILRSIIGTPIPPCEVMIVGWRSVKGSPKSPHFRRDLMTEVLIGGFQGPIGGEVPEDVVRNGPPNQSTLGHKKQVHSGLPVELKDLASVHPLLQGIRSTTPLYALPSLGGAT